MQGTIKGRSYRFSVITCDCHYACLWANSFQKQSSSIICDHIKILSCHKYAAHNVQTCKHFQWQNPFWKKTNSVLQFHSKTFKLLDFPGKQLFSRLLWSHRFRGVSWKMPDFLSAPEKSRKVSYTCIASSKIYTVDQYRGLLQLL